MSRDLHSFAPLLALLLLATFADLRVHSSQLNAAGGSHHTGHLNGLIHQVFGLAIKRGRDPATDGGKIAIRHVKLDAETSFLAALPVGMNNVGKAVAERIAEVGMWTPSETAVLIQLLKRNCGQAGKPQLVVDVGCNVGWFCAVAAAYGCKCMAFDGSVEATTYLRMTAQLNGWHGRVDVRTAVVTNDTSVRFDGWFVVDNKLNASVASSNATYAMPAVRLDDAIQEPVLYMKVDVEGWEVSAFDSAASTIAKQPPKYIFFEITFYLNSAWRSGYTGTLMYLYQHGYKCAQTHSPKALHGLETEQGALAWFEQLKSQCDTASRSFCQEELFCVHSSAGCVPSDIASLLAL